MSESGTITIRRQRIEETIVPLGAEVYLFGHGCRSGSDTLTLDRATSGPSLYVVNPDGSLAPVFLMDCDKWIVRAHAEDLRPRQPEDAFPVEHKRTDIQPRGADRNEEVQP